MLGTAIAAVMVGTGMAARRSKVAWGLWIPTTLLPATTTVMALRAGPLVTLLWQSVRLLEQLFFSKLLESKCHAALFF
uniref:Uncharacterized protein n=1 Tax=Arundo donax TaxID=35708 RepID=A0A0A8ZDL0_ARUDO